MHHCARNSVVSSWLNDSLSFPSLLVCSILTMRSKLDQREWTSLRDAPPLGLSTFFEFSSQSFDNLTVIAISSLIVVQHILA